MTVSTEDVSALSPGAVRARIRAGLDMPTSGLGAGYVQTNLMMLPAADALGFLTFCVRNPKPLPLVEVLDPGRFEPVCAPGADVRTDLGRYDVWRDGELVESVSDVRALWRDDFVTFLTGCSFSFEAGLLAAGIPLRHMELGTNPPMYRTDRSCASAGRFQGPLVVSMRPIPAHLVVPAIELCAGFPQAHGAPVHVGDPAALGIEDLARPFAGGVVPVAPGELPVFWACGATLRALVATSRVPFCVTHVPGYQFVTDVRNDAYGA